MEWRGENGVRGVKNGVRGKWSGGKWSGGGVRGGEGRNEGRRRGSNEGRKSMKGRGGRVEHHSFSFFTLRPGSVVTSFTFKQGLGYLSLRSSTSCTSYAAAGGGMAN